MDRTRVLAYAAAIIFIMCLAAPAGARFIGTGVAFDKQFGDTINVNINKNIALGDSAFGLAGANVGVTWGVNCDLATMAGYPYGYGGIGAVTEGDVGFGLGLTMDTAAGAGFNGADFGVPLTEQGITTTHFAQVWGDQNHIANENAILPFSGFPVM